MRVRIVLPLLASILFGNGVALADRGSVRLTSGEVLSGDVQQVTKGQYVLIFVNGEHRILRWADIASIDEPAPAPTHAPAPAPTHASALDPAPTEAPPAHDVPSSGDQFHAAFNPGARIASMSGGPRRDAAWMFQLEAGYHFSPSWSVYGLWEHGELGSDLGDYGYKDVRTEAFGVGFKAATNGRGVFGFFWDFSLAYRSLRYQSTNTYYDSAAQQQWTTRSTSKDGFEYFRMALGFSIRGGSKVRIEPLAYLEAGDVDVFAGLGVGGRWDL